MLSSNWYVTLRFTVFEIFAVKQPKFRTKISNLRTQWVPPPKGEKICPGPICTIMQNFEPVGATVAEISVTGQKKTNIWRVIVHTCRKHSISQPYNVSRSNNTFTLCRSVKSCQIAM